MNPNQQRAFEAVASAASLSAPHSSNEVEQAPTYLKEPVQVGDHNPSESTDESDANHDA
jgi:hypothetical protein